MRFNFLHKVLSNFRNNEINVELLRKLVGLYCQDFDSSCDKELLKIFKLERYILFWLNLHSNEILTVFNI